MQKEWKKKLKARARKAETKNCSYIWQQAKSLSQNNKGRSGLVAPHSSWGLRDLVLKMMISPPRLLHCSLFFLFTHYSHQCMEKGQGTTGPPSPKPMESRGRREGMPYTHRTSTLSSFDWGISSNQKIPNYPENLVLHPFVLKRSGFQTIGQTSLKSVWLAIGD